MSIIKNKHGYFLQPINRQASTIVGYKETEQKLKGKKVKKSLHSNKIPSGTIFITKAANNNQSKLKCDINPIELEAIFKYNSFNITLDALFDWIEQLYTCAYKDIPKCTQLIKKPIAISKNTVSNIEYIYYTVKKFNPSKAISITKLIADSLFLLVKNPYLGTSLNNSILYELKINFEKGNYVIIYSYSNNSDIIIILNIQYQKTF
jgi:plasmid stabilization system protein ParE